MTNPFDEPPGAYDEDEVATHVGAADLRSYLSISSWADRDIPPPDRLLGDLLTTTTRMFLVGRTGLGKTMLGMGMACGVASGSGFLHWRSLRPARVLYIDGEMPAELIKARSIDVLRRAQTVLNPDNLLIFSRDTMEDFSRRYPFLGPFAPLNTEAGRTFLNALICDIDGVDLIIFDNVMSLIEGDQKDEIPWSETLPLVSSLTAKRIGQIWLDHTGHNTDRQYGSATKAWRFDAVGLMTPLAEDQRERHELAFTLSFEAPGKARRRTPDNFRDFETCTIRLRQDEWTSSPTRDGLGGKPVGKVAPSRKPFYDALVAAIGKSAIGTGTTLVTTWEMECLRRGLIEALPAGRTETEPYHQRDRRYKGFRTAKSDLLAAGWIGIDGDRVIDLRGRWA